MHPNIYDIYEHYLIINGVTRYFEDKQSMLAKFNELRATAKNPIDEDGTAFHTPDKKLRIVMVSQPVRESLRSAIYHMVILTSHGYQAIGYIQEAARALNPYKLAVLADWLASKQLVTDSVLTELCKYFREEALDKPTITDEYTSAINEAIDGFVITAQTLSAIRTLSKALPHLTRKLETYVTADWKSPTAVAHDFLMVATSAIQAAEEALRMKPKEATVLGRTAQRKLTIANRKLK